MKNHRNLKTFSEFCFEKEDVYYYNLQITKEHEKKGKIKRKITMKKKQIITTVFTTAVAAATVLTVVNSTGKRRG